MAISKASRRGGRAVSVQDEADDRAAAEEGRDGQPPSRGRKVLPTRKASEGIEAALKAEVGGKADGATHVMLTRAVVDGRSLVPGDRVKLSPTEAAHLAKQGAVKAL